MRSSVLTEEDVGEIEHEWRLKPGQCQLVVFQEGDLPLILEPDAPKYDKILQETEKKFLNIPDLKKVLEGAMVTKKQLMHNV